MIGDRHMQFLNGEKPCWILICLPFKKMADESSPSPSSFLKVGDIEQALAPETTVEVQTENVVPAKVCPAVQGKHFSVFVLPRFCEIR